MKILLDRLNCAAATAEDSLRQNKIPGLAMAFIKNGRLISSQCMGYADPERGRIIDGGTYFEAASLTKPFFARLVFKLADEGLLELDRPLCEYAPHWIPSDDARFLRITARDVLCHATGLPNWGWLPLPLLFEPQRGFGYSGMGYYYLQSVIEKLAATRLDDLAQRQLMDPFGMDTAALIWTGAMRSSLARTADENGDIEPARTGARHSMGMEPNSAFSLFVTINDYPKFIMNIMQEEGFAERVRSVRNAAGHGIEWGLGWGLYNEKLWHWGDNGGFKSFVCFDPQTKDGLLIHTNGFNGLKVCFDVAECATGDSFEDVAAMIAEAE